jgi:hypothetical protein
MPQENEDIRTRPVLDSLVVPTVQDLERMVLVIC